MWDILQITHEGTTKVKRERLSTLPHKYELFKIKPEENINQMKTRFIHIVSYMKTLGKTFLNEKLVVKIMRFLNHSQQPKATLIYECRDLITINRHIIFDKLKEHEMEVKRVVGNEEGDKKKNKNIESKGMESKGQDGRSEINKYMKLMFQNFKKFPRHEKQISSF